MSEWLHSGGGKSGSWEQRPYFEQWVGESLTLKDWGKVGVAIATVHERHPEWIKEGGKVFGDNRMPYLRELAKELQKVFDGFEPPTADI